MPDYQPEIGCEFLRATESDEACEMLSAPSKKEPNSKLPGSGCQIVVQDTNRNIQLLTLEVHL